MKIPANILLLLIVVLLLIGSYKLGSFMIEDARYGEEVVVISRFRQIEAALNDYHKANGEFPPARYQRNPGEPFHSWRVLLFVYDDNSSKYNFAKEWDDVENIRAIGKMAPFIYTTTENQNFYTNVITVGPDDQWAESLPLMSWVVRNGADSFVLFEKPNSEIEWAKPIY